MKKFLFVAACIMFLVPGLANAYIAELDLSDVTNYTTIYYKWNDVSGIGGGGSFSPAYLDQNAFQYLYCADLFTNVGAQVYPNTEVNTSGIIYGSALSGAGQVAWLLSSYAAAADTYDEQYALQSAIWRVTEGTGFTLDTASGRTSGTQFALYNSYLAALDGNTANVSNFLWISPKTTETSPYAQGLVGTVVPIPAAAWLLGSGVLGLVALGRRRLMK